MTERINGQGFRPTDTAGTRRTDGAKPAPASTGGSTQSSAASAQHAADKVNLTRSGLLMSKLEELVQSLPVVDAERVSAIKEALASGSYAIDDQAVADKMIRLDRELVA
jgi:negative regulator of flagellin synthesis FlgM